MKSMTKRSHLVASIAGMVLLAGLALGAGANWTVVASPSPGQTNFLYSASGVSSSDVWAVGYQYSQSGLLKSIVEHFDGTAWTAVANPNPGNAHRCRDSAYVGTVLQGVTAISSQDVWAVGQICGAGTGKSLTEHWDGTKWTTVVSPNPPDSEDAILVSVAAVASNDVWAVGNYQVQNQYLWETLVEHWDGSKWSILKTPNAPNSDKSFLNAVGIASASDIWAVGYSENPSTDQDIPLIEHYDGQSWAQVASPYTHQSGFNALWGVSVVSSNDVWAVGYANENSQGKNGQGLVQHWDGTQWSLVDSPIAGAATILLSVAARSSSDIWAVGYIQSQRIQFLPVTEHWDGANWTVVTPPNPGKVAQVLGVTNAGGSIVGVGAYSTSPMTAGYMVNPQTLTMLH